MRRHHSTPGEFGRSQNWIGPQGSRPENALYVPPPVDELMPALGNWEVFLHERDVLPDLIQCAVMHEQFEAIHPFLDGNGRVGQLLITLFMVERGRLTQPLLYLSAARTKHLLGCSTPTALKAIAELEERKIVTEATGRQRNRVYVAREILDVLQAPIPA